jgi:hypothetical protein
MELEQQHQEMSTQHEETSTVLVAIRKTHETTASTVSTLESDNLALIEANSTLLNDNKKEKKEIVEKLEIQQTMDHLILITSHASQLESMQNKLDDMKQKMEAKEKAMQELKTTLQQETKQLHANKVVHKDTIDMNLQKQKVMQEEIVKFQKIIETYKQTVLSLEKQNEQNVTSMEESNDSKETLGVQLTATQSSHDALLFKHQLLIETHDLETTSISSSHELEIKKHEQIKSIQKSKLLKMALQKWRSNAMSRCFSNWRQYMHQLQSEKQFKQLKQSEFNTESLKTTLLEQEKKFVLIYEQEKILTTKQKEQQNKNNQLVLELEKEKKEKETHVENATKQQEKATTVLQASENKFQKKEDELQLLLTMENIISQLVLQEMSEQQKEQQKVQQKVHQQQLNSLNTLRLSLEQKHQTEMKEKEQEQVLVAEAAAAAAAASATKEIQNQKNQFMEQHAEALQLAGKTESAAVIAAVAEAEAAKDAAHQTMMNDAHAEINEESNLNKLSLYAAIRVKSVLHRLRMKKVLQLQGKELLQQLKETKLKTEEISKVEKIKLINLQTDHSEEMLKIKKLKEKELETATLNFTERRKRSKEEHRLEAEQIGITSRVEMASLKNQHDQKDAEIKRLQQIRTNEQKMGKYSSEGAAREWSTIVDISIHSPSFQPVSLSLPRSSLSKTPKQVFFNPINIFDSFTHSITVL